MPLRWITRKRSRKPKMKRVPPPVSQYFIYDPQTKELYDIKATSEREALAMVSYKNKSDMENLKVVDPANRPAWEKY